MNKHICLECGKTFPSRRRVAKYCSLPHSLTATHRSVTGRITPRLRPIAHPTTLDIAWAAGLYEGEGSASVTGVKHGLGNSRVSVSQQDRWILDRLAHLFGGSVGRANPHCLVWSASGALARGFLMTIYTFLSPWRKAQARRALGLAA